jgi:gamma-glutamylcyclotransferase (GGCT)/AIG2-like uncharacterized protein YtfP
MPELLFAYGTLMPDDPGTAAREGWVADGVRGRLFDLGPYPALIDCDDPTAGWVEGYVRSADPGELNGRLDAYEGVDEGLYRRVVTTTRAGRQVWVYVYARPIPASAPGPLTRWRRPASPSHLPVKEASDGHNSRPGPDS